MSRYWSWWEKRWEAEREAARLREEGNLRYQARQREVHGNHLAEHMQELDAGSSRRGRISYSDWRKLYLLTFPPVQVTVPSLKRDEYYRIYLWDMQQKWFQHLQHCSKGKQSNLHTRGVLPYGDWLKFYMAAKPPPRIQDFTRYDGRIPEYISMPQTIYK